MSIGHKNVLPDKQLEMFLLRWFFAILVQRSNQYGEQNNEILAYSQVSSINSCERTPVNSRKFKFPQNALNSFQVFVDFVSRHLLTAPSYRNGMYPVLHRRFVFVCRRTKTCWVRCFGLAAIFRLIGFIFRCTVYLISEFRMDFVRLIHYLLAYRYRIITCIRLNHFYDPLFVRSFLID